MVQSNTAERLDCEGNQGKTDGYRRAVVCGQRRGREIMANEVMVAATSHRGRGASGISHGHSGAQNWSMY